MGTELTCGGGTSCPRGEGGGPNGGPDSLGKSLGPGAHLAGEGEAKAQRLISGTGTATVVQGCGHEGQQGQLHPPTHRHMVTCGEGSLPICHLSFSLLLAVK